MKKIIFALAIAVFTASTIFSQTLNLEQVRTLALLNSQSLERSNLSVMNSLLVERNHFFTMIPRLSAGYRASADFLGDDWRFVNPLENYSLSASLTISQTIFDGGRIFIQRDILALNTESARLSALAEYFNVLDSADNAYYAVLEAIATLESEESSFQTAIFSLSMAEIRLESGMINRGDFLRAQADLESRQNSLNQARRNLNLAITRFLSITGLPEFIPLEPIDLSQYEDLIVRLGSIIDSEAELLYENLWSIIQASNPSLSRSAIGIQTAEMNHSSILREYLPSISASLTTPSLSYAPSPQGFSITSGGSISITGTIPLDFWVLNNRLERSQIGLNQSSMDYTTAINTMQIDLFSILFTTFSNAGSVLSSRRSLEYTEQHFEFVMERYRLGQSSISDLQEASTMLINSQNSHTRALYGFLQSLSRIRSMTAMEEEEMLINILMGRN